MACFLDLAFETLVQILSPLSCRDLASTSRLCRRLNAICRPLLYTSPVLSPPPCNPTATTPSLRIFLSTILRPGNETLASHVRSLHVQWENYERSPATDISFLTANASRLNFQYPMGSQSAQLTLLLHLLPRLTILEFSCAPSRRSIFTTFMESLSPQTLPLALRSLREFRCPLDEELPTPYVSNETFYRPRIYPTAGVSSKTLYRLMMLPNIRSIDVHVVSGKRFPKSMFEAGANQSVLYKLRLVHADRYPRWASFMPTVPHTLTRYSYSVFVDEYNFNLGWFLKSLMPLQGTLQFLHLDFCGLNDPTCSDYDGYNHDGLYTAGSFRDWPALQSLSCSLMTLLGRDPPYAAMRLVQVLPKGLCEFEILQDVYWQTEEFVQQFEELLVQKEAVVPALKRVAFGPMLSQCMLSAPGWWEDTTTEWSSVEVACESVGVELIPGPLEW